MPLSDSELINVSFSSDYRYERVSTKSSLPFSLAPSTFPTLSVNHGLGYKPYFRAYYSFNNDYYLSMFSGPDSYDAGNGFQVDNVWADETKLYFQLENTGVATINGCIYYRVYAEQQI